MRQPRRIFMAMCGISFSPTKLRCDDFAGILMLDPCRELGTLPISDDD